MDNINPNILGYLNISNDRGILIQDSSLVDHPLQGVVECHGWSWMKRGDEQTFGVTKNIGHCEWQRTCILLCNKWQKCLLRRNLLSKITSPLPLWEYTEVRIRRTTVILVNTPMLIVSISTTTICWSSSTTKLQIKFSHSWSMVIRSLDDWITAYTKLWILKNPQILPGYVLCCSSLSTHSTKHQLYHVPSSPKSDVAWNMTGLCSRIILHDLWQVILFFPQRFRFVEQ